jgi:hypothetical protein
LGTAQATEWTAPNSPCGNCHAIDALAQRAAGAVGTADGGVVANVTHGELEYRIASSGPPSDSNYVGAATVAEVYCTTCHAVTNANDPHVTGLPWTPGSFPLVVASGASDTSFLEKSPSTSAVVGMSAGTLGSANTCVECHKSRKDVTSYIGASNVLTSVYWGPHEGPQADVFSGEGGYHYLGQTYGESTHQQKLTCIDCHMPPVATNSGVPDHSFAPRLSACQSCHVDATSFDIDGGQSLIKTAMFFLEAGLNSAGYLTRSTAAPYAALAGTQLTDGAFDTDQPRPGGPALTADQAGALYNYILIARGGATGVHNPKYTQQLIYDSYNAITGNVPPINIPRPN